MDLRRERDIEQLRKVALAQQTQIEHLVHTLTQKCRELERLQGREGELQQTLALLEQLGRAPTAAASTETPSKPQRARTPKKGHGPSAQTELEQVTETYELDAPDRQCPQCGGELSVWKGQYERSEMVDVVQVRYQLVTVQRQKYRCRCGGCVETALGPERAVEGGRYSLAFGAKVVTDKYLDHLPLERQVRILRRHGLKVTSQTLWDLVYRLSQALRPTWEALLQKVLSQPVIGLDQTGWKRLSQRKGRPWQMWCLTAPGMAYHRICEDKSAATFTQLVGGYRGVIVCDALGTHAAGAREGPGITLAGCWAHVLRRFRDAEPNFPQARRMLQWIGQLYEVEHEADRESVRGRLRAERSAPTLEAMKAWLLAEVAVPKTALYNAMRYTLAQWARLTRFLEDPRIPLDNNATERGLRGPVVGRKNHYGSKSKRGTEAAAILYSLLETSKLQGIEPTAYLIDAVRAARRGEVQLPGQLLS